MRIAAIVLAALAGAASARLAGQDPKSAPVVKGSRFELVDGAGRTRAVLGMSKTGAPELDLRDAEGRPRALLVLDRDNLPILLLKDAEVVTRAKLELDAKGAAKLTMSDPSGETVWKAP